MKSPLLTPSRLAILQKSRLKLTIATLGIVFGDIGTSPLYALRECFAHSERMPVNPENVIGIIALIFWSLVLVVGIKYLVFVLRANNQGEGGIMALTAMLQSDPVRPRRSFALLTAGLFGAALLFGDGLITPAISVLSAVEGLQVAAPALSHWVVPLTAVILVALFAIQDKGTAKVGSWFGPLISVWFLTIAAIGIPWIFRRPEILAALNPYEALRFFLEHGFGGIRVLSGVVLCITGAEALYADMGHFGIGPIRLGWFAVAFPSLCLNYFGQGALLLEKGNVVLGNPFYSLVSGWLQYPLIILATCATVIASQALISGTYSLTQQAIHLGYFPRTDIRHTSRETAGQIYIPRANQLLMIGSILLVLVFQKASSLAAAYGLSVTGTMLVTSILYLAVIRKRWKWRKSYAIALVASFLIVDTAFLGSNMGKFFQGGWIPFLIAGFIFAMMVTWRKGRQALQAATAARSIPLDQFATRLARWRPARVRGTGVFMSAAEGVIPAALLHHLEHTRALHERIILLTIKTERQPFVEERGRIQITGPVSTTGAGISGLVNVVAHYGYMQRPDISEILIYCLEKGLELNINELAFVLGRETVLGTGSTRMMAWQKRLFIFMARNARPVSDYFGMPPDRVVEVGMQVEI
ncbi:MAG: hypothetical protein A2X97_11320 [Bdellovibrionales bacterium GWA1_52_35]|nr:MAG: hypothetical protein A2X97_11320 [Bdellovibrionales bacterium GWA1_52_35]HCM39177.1 potassium transporter Kup [Bdellovibrionales bacterium]